MIEVVAGAIIIDRKLLCFQRGKAKFDYISFGYEFPGGKLEAGESPQEALKRELIEELELEVEVGDHVITVEHHYPDFSIKMHCYICHADSYDGTLNDHVDFKALCSSQLDDVNWIAADIPIKDAIKEKYSNELC